jgi:ribonuclease HI
VIINDGKEDIIFGSEKESTNNRMELTAAINALLKIKQDKKIKIYTDSKYVKDGIDKWINNWKLNNWKNSNKKDVKNKDLWTKLDNIISKKEITWNWVKAHSVNEYNNKVDLLARNAANAND